MTVQDLLDYLTTQRPEALVVLWQRDACDGIMVQDLEIRGTDDDGDVVLEVT